MQGAKPSSQDELAYSYIQVLTEVYITDVVYISVLLYQVPGIYYSSRVTLRALS